MAVAAPARAQTLSAVMVRGSTMYGPEELFGVYRDRLGQPIDRESVQSIAEALRALYQRDGYLRPQLSLDQRLLSRGILGIDVVEPRIAGARIEGHPGPHRARIERLAAQLDPARPFKPAELQQLLQQLRSLPGLTLTTRTEADARQTGHYVLVLDARYKPVSGELRMNNRGTEEIGGSFAMGRMSFNGLLGRREKFGVLFASASDFDGYHGGGLFAETAFGARSWRVAGMGFKSTSDPRELPEDLSDLYLRERATLAVSYPAGSGFFRPLTFTAGLEFDDLRIEREAQALREDRLRILSMSATAGWRSRAATQYLTTLELRKGLDAFGSGLYTLGEADGRRKDFLAVRTQFVLLQPFAQSWSVRLDAFGQYSPHLLPYGERFKIGGARVARGLEVPQIAGDSGVAAKAELRRELVNSSRFGRISAYGFCDIAASWRQNIPGRESASTAGIGIALRGQHLTGHIEWARALAYPQTLARQSPGLFAELSILF